MTAVDRNRTSTRDRILDVAFDLFVEVGFAGSTVTEIERRVGLSAGSGSFYRHFRSKEELLPAAIEREVAKAIADAAVAVPADDPDCDPRVLWLHRVLAWLRRLDRLNRVLLNEGDRVPAIRETISVALRDIADALSWDNDPAGVVGVLALNGYLLFSRALGTPFFGVDEHELIGVLAALGTRNEPMEPADERTAASGRVTT